MKNKQGNMYEFAESVNFLHGECSHKCTYCSTKSLMRFPVMQKCYTGKLRLNTKAFEKNLGKGKTIFVCGQNDLFAYNVKWEYIQDILNYIIKFPDNRYFFQTKNPSRMNNFIYDFPANSILCTTIENECNYLSKATTCIERAIMFEQIKEFEKHVTIEPIIDFSLKDFVELLKLTGASQFNIGADSKRHNLPEPSKEKVLQLISELEKIGKVHLKSNLNRIIK